MFASNFLAWNLENEREFLEFWERILVGTIYAFEFVGAEYRAAMGAFAYIAFDVGMMLLSPLAFFFPHWRQMAVGMAILPLPFLPMFFWMPDSLQFIYAK